MKNDNKAGLQGKDLFFGEQKKIHYSLLPAPIHGSTVEMAFHGSDTIGRDGTKEQFSLVKHNAQVLSKSNYTVT